MKVKDFIKELEKLDQEKEIMTSTYEDIMGYCDFHDPYISTDTALKYDYVKQTKKGPRNLKGYSSKISNWTPDSYEEIEIYLIGS